MAPLVPSRTSCTVDVNSAMRPKHQCWHGRKANQEPACQATARFKHNATQLLAAIPWCLIASTAVSSAHPHSPSLHSLPPVPPLPLPLYPSPCPTTPKPPPALCSPCPPAAPADAQTQTGAARSTPTQAGPQPSPSAAPGQSPAPQSQQPSGRLRRPAAARPLCQTWTPAPSSAAGRNKGRKSGMGGAGMEGEG